VLVVQYQVPVSRVGTTCTGHIGRCLCPRQMTVYAIYQQGVLTYKLFAL